MKVSTLFLEENPNNNIYNVICKIRNSVSLLHMLYFPVMAFDRYFEVEVMTDKPYAHNPLLPANTFVPDVEARQWADGRMYLYGSWDIGGKDDYCSALYHTFSSQDLVSWTGHGVSLRSSGPENDVSWSTANLYAPDVILKDGLYYLYFCLSDGSEGVAASPSPTGPFKNATRITGMDGIDPGVFTDEDGQAYIYWGQFDKVRAAKLNPNMRSIELGTMVQPLSVAEHNFHEGCSMRKHNSIYYYVYADTGRHAGRPTCLGYSTATSPLGPFTYRGVIIDNYGCDPKVWNNHGSLAKFDEKWYVFYHRSSKGTIFNRRVCAEPITFNADGTISEVEMTSQGIGGPIDARNHIDAGVACLLSGTIRIDGCPLGLGGDQLSQITDGDWAAYKYLDFGSGTNSFVATVGSRGSGTLELRLDNPDGAAVGICTLPETGSEGKYTTVSCTIQQTKGVHALYLKFVGMQGAATNVARFHFE
jgi:arabinoxylan arabinofuranohydrolase